MTDIIKTENLTFAYPPDEGKEPVLALQGIDLSITQGSFTVVLGHNGSGKSTLAKHMNAVLLPGGGTVWVDGLDRSAAGWVWCSKTRITKLLPTW